MEVLKQQMQQLQPILEARAEDFTAFAALAHAAATSGQLPELSQVPQQVLITGGCATVLVLLMLLPRGRRLLWETADTVLATIAAIALLVVLIVTLLSVPVGMAYVSLKGLQFLAASLAGSYPALAKLIPQMPALMQSG